MHTSNYFQLESQSCVQWAAVFTRNGQWDHWGGCYFWEWRSQHISRRNGRGKHSWIVLTLFLVTNYLLRTPWLIWWFEGFQMFCWWTLKRYHVLHLYSALLSILWHFMIHVHMRIPFSYLPSLPYFKVQTITLFNNPLLLGCERVWESQRWHAYSQRIFERNQVRTPWQCVSTYALYSVLFFLIFCFCFWCVVLRLECVWNLVLEIKYWWG